MCSSYFVPGGRAEVSEPTSISSQSSAPLPPPVQFGSQILGWSTGRFTCSAWAGLYWEADQPTEPGRETPTEMGTS